MKTNAARLEQRPTATKIQRQVERLRTSVKSVSVSSLEFTAAIVSAVMPFCELPTADVGPDFTYDESSEMTTLHGRNMTAYDNDITDAFSHLSAHDR